MTNHSTPSWATSIKSTISINKINSPNSFRVFQRETLQIPLNHKTNNINLFKTKSIIPKCLANRYAKITSDQYRRTRFMQSELERKVLRSLLSSSAVCGVNKSRRNFRRSNKSFKKVKRINVRFSQLVFNPAINRKMQRKINSSVRIRNRCVLTSHPSSIGKLGISRIVFRTLAGFGKLPGIKKI